MPKCKERRFTETNDSGSDTTNERRIYVNQKN